MKNNQIFPLFPLPVEELIDRFKLPLHINYAPRIRENLRAFKKVFDELYPEGVIRYAAKACTHPEILKIVKEEAMGIDASSENEALCGLESGIPAKDIDLNGNCKEDHHIKDAILKGMLIISDSIQEMDVVNGIAGREGIKPAVLLRISGYDLGEVTASSVFTAGLWTKFGAPLKDIPNFIKDINKYENINFLGFHTHIGSQITDVAPYFAVMGKMLEMGHLLRQKGIKCKIINIGGGYPISYIDEKTWEYIQNKIKDGIVHSLKGDNSRIFSWNNYPGGFGRDHQGNWDFSQWKGEKFYTPYPKEEMLRKLLTGRVRLWDGEISTLEALKSLDNPVLAVEPGRSIVEDAGITLARVGHVRPVAGEHDMITIEMGVTNHCDSLVEPSMKKWEILEKDEIQKEETPFECFVGGNLCFSGDMIARYKISLSRKPKRGEIVIMRDTGAYSSHFMPSNANAYPRPHSILVDEKGKISILRKRDSYRDLFYHGD